MDNNEMAAEWAGLVVRFCLATAAGDSLRTVYHDRIDGLLLTEEDACWL